MTYLLNLFHLWLLTLLKSWRYIPELTSTSLNEKAEFPDYALETNISAEYSSFFPFQWTSNPSNLLRFTDDS